MSFSIIIPISMAGFFILKKYFGWFKEQSDTDKDKDQSFQQLNET
jgi:hypothetical protein